MPMSKEAWERLAKAVEEVQLSREDLLELSRDGNSTVRAGFCRTLPNTKFRDDPELQRRVLESLADEDVEVRLRAAETALKMRLDVKDYWVRIHKDETRECISITRMWQLVYNPELITDVERAHIQGCRYCMRNQNLTREEKGGI